MKKKREAQQETAGLTRDDGVINNAAAKGGAPNYDAAAKISALLCCAASLFWLRSTPIAAFCFGVFLVLCVDRAPPFLQRHGGKIFVAASALLVAFGVAVRVFMYTENRSLWLDEAMLASSICGRNWKELLASPLSAGQSAPALYLVAVKAIGAVFGYSEFSLRIFSFLMFFGLLAVEYILLKKVLSAGGVKTAFAMAATAVMPCFVYYSNELKPYMGDAFFVLLTLLLYALYAKNKLSLLKLTVLYVLVLGLCTPSAFFVGGILAAEFLDAVFAKDRKRAVYAAIASASVAAVFCVYYWWWMLPTNKQMDGYWNRTPDKTQFNAFFIALGVSLYLLWLKLRAGAAYTKEKRLFMALAASYILITLLCPPAALFCGGIIGGELLSALFAGNKKRIVSRLAALLSTAAVFGLYYYARTAFVSGALKDFWGNTQGKTALVNGIRDVFLVFNIDYRLVWALAPFALLGVWSLIRQRNKVAYAVTLSAFFAALASSIGKWPLSGRLWLFLPAVAAVFSAAGLGAILKTNNAALKKTAACVCLAVIVHWSKLCVDTCAHKPEPARPLTPGATVELNQIIRFSNTRVWTEEANPLIKYVQENIKDGQSLYVYPPAGHILKFKNGYNAMKIGRTQKDNIIYGENGDEWLENKIGPELDAIIKSKKAYLLFQHYWRGIEPGLTALSQHGSIDPVMIYYDTPLLYFEAKEPGGQ